MPQFIGRYGCCGPDGGIRIAAVRRMDERGQRKACDAVLAHMLGKIPREEQAVMQGTVQVGVTMIFIKNAKARSNLETIRDAVCAASALSLQRSWRGKQAREVCKQLAKARKWCRAALAQSDPDEARRHSAREDTEHLLITRSYNEKRRVAQLRYGLKI